VAVGAVVCLIDTAAAQPEGASASPVTEEVKKVATTIPKRREYNYLRIGNCFSCS